MHVPEHDGTQDLCGRGVRTALQRQIQTVSGDTTNVSGDFFIPCRSLYFIRIQY